MQITKKLFLRNPKLPKDLSTSNVVTVNRSSMTYPCSPNVTITLPHKCWRWRWRSRPQGREDLEKRFRCHKSNTSAYLHTYSDHDDLRNPRSSWDCRSRRCWTKSGNSTARRRVAVVWSLSCTALQQATWERERWRVAVRGRPAHQGGGRRARGYSCRGKVMIATPSWGPFI
jgi:hypothetical protein